MVVFCDVLGFLVASVLKSAGCNHPGCLDVVPRGFISVKC